MDLGSGLIRKAELTPANRLVCGDERAFHADKAYEQEQRRQRFKAHGIKGRILHRSHKHQAALL